MQGLVDIWVDVQSWILETAVHPLLFRFGYMTFFEDAPFVVETLMLGVVQIAVILLVFRPLERLAPAEQWPDRKLARVDIVYTLLSKLGVLPFVVFIVLYPVNDWLQDLVRDYDLVLPTVEQSVPWLRDKPLLLFATYFLLYDFAGYWLHRMQHAFPWWWALHSLHHSQRQVTCWSDDRNHLIDDLLASVYFAVVALLIGVQPGQYVILLLLSRMVESLSHANVRFGFGRMLDKVLVPRHRDYDGLPLSQSRIGKSCGGDEDFDASCDARLATDQSGALEGEHHLVDRRRRDVEVALHVGFGWSLMEHARIDIDEGQIVALLLGEAMRVGVARGA